MGEYEEEQAEREVETARAIFEENFDVNPIEQERRWAALDASVPCAHTIPGTCDYC